MSEEARGRGIGEGSGIETLGVPIRAIAELIGKGHDTPPSLLSHSLPPHPFIWRSPLFPFTIPTVPPSCGDPSPNIFPPNHFWTRLTSHLSLHTWPLIIAAHLQWRTSWWHGTFICLQYYPSQLLPWIFLGALLVQSQFTRLVYLPRYDPVPTPPSTRKAGDAAGRA